MNWFSRLEVLARVLRWGSFMENHKLNYPQNEHISFKAALRNSMPLHSGGNRDIFILCLIRNKMFFWLFLFLKPTHSPTALVYQLFESEVRLRAVSLFLCLYSCWRKKFGFPCINSYECWVWWETAMQARGGGEHVYSTSLFWQLVMTNWLVPDHPRIMFFYSHNAREWSYYPILSFDNWGK